MSNHKFGIGHVIGLGFSAVSLASKQIRYITIERYSLPSGQDTLRSSLELGPESGDRNLLVTYVVDPGHKRLRDLKSREFPAAIPGRSLKSNSESVAFEESMHHGYPEIARRFTRDGKDFSAKGHWTMDGDGRPLQLVFDRKPARQFYFEAGVEACLETEEGPAMTIFVVDSGISERKLLSKALKIKESTFLNAGLEQKTAVPIICYGGAKSRPNLRLEIDAAGELQTVWNQEYDSLGRPSVFKVADAPGNVFSFNALHFFYSPDGALLRVEANSNGQVEIREFQYGQNGWPERLLHYVQAEGGQIRILSRSFFKFRQQ